jgi:hypothetical protein
MNPDAHQDVRANRVPEATKDRAPRLAHRPLHDNRARHNKR